MPEWSGKFKEGDVVAWKGFTEESLKSDAMDKDWKAGRLTRKSNAPGLWWVDYLGCEMPMYEYEIVPVSKIPKGDPIDHRFNNLIASK